MDKDKHKNDNHLKNWSQFRNDFNYFSRVSRNGRQHYEPWYDDRADYNTNAKSYYDYLARFNRWINVATAFINRLMDRDVKVEDTNSVDLTKIGDWHDDDCDLGRYSDIITLKADVKLSKATEDFTHELLTDELEENGLSIKDDGLFTKAWDSVLTQTLDLIKALQDKVKDLEQRLQALSDKLDREIKRLDDKNREQDGRLDGHDTDISNLNDRVDGIDNRLTTLENKPDTAEPLKNALNKIVSNLYESGAITSDDLESFDFKPNRHIASGNINLFGGTQDGDSFIRTSDNQSENDITAGV